MDDFTTFKEEVKNRVDIVDVVSEFVELKKRGVNYSAPCPFHQETKPSFNVNRERQFFHCFGCGKGGDVLTFLTEITGMSFMEALAQLTERAGMQMPEREPADRGRKDAADRIAAANVAAAEYYHTTLHEPAGAEGLSYLEDRKLTRETIRAFRLGFAPADARGLLEFAKKKRVSPADLEAAGIIKTRDYGGAYHHFGGRVIFPIIDQTARVLGFGARLLAGEGAKYKNSPESAVYHKSRVLYGIYQARQELKRARTAIVVEGYMDVISLHQAGIRNAIAASGTAFTADQGRIINRMARNVVLLFDGDRAGLAAAARGADTLLETDLNLGVVVLPEGDDPDSFVLREGPDRLRELLAKPEGIWEFKLRALAGAGPEQRLALAGDVADSISHMPDELKRNVYIRDMASRLGIEIDAMRRAVEGRIRRRRRPGAAEPKPDPAAGSIDEKFLLSCLLLFPECARMVMNGPGAKPFASPVYRAIARELFRRMDEGLETSPSSLLTAFEDAHSQQAITAAAMNQVEYPRAHQFVTDFIRHCRIEEIHREQAALRRLIPIETDPARKRELMEQADGLLRQLEDLAGE
jgi:DNA primase